MGLRASKGKVDKVQIVMVPLHQPYGGLLQNSLFKSDHWQAGIGQLVNHDCDT